MRIKGSAGEGGVAMASVNETSPLLGATDRTNNLKAFVVEGLFGRDLSHRIEFPRPNPQAAKPDLLILLGPNGCGKTTILRMIGGFLSLDFDVFRQIPFSEASLELYSGDTIRVTRTKNNDFPLEVEYGAHVATLSMSKHGYDEEQGARVNAFRESALPVFSSINFQLLDIHRSLALQNESKITADDYLKYSYRTPPDRDEERKNLLARRVFRFIREAQVNYRRFFEAAQLELLPRILESIRRTKEDFMSVASLREKVEAMKTRNHGVGRFGLQTDDADISTIEEILSLDKYVNDDVSRAVLESYVEMLENRTQTRELIAKRLLGFEEIMDEFLIGKRVRIDPRNGLAIEDGRGRLKETDLSSGEYHFLYMMVTALLCQREGSIIAVDEPELSLHVTWQRKVVSALAKCAAGASPLFLFATHSAAITAEHLDKSITLQVE